MHLCLCFLFRCCCWGVCVFARCIDLAQFRALKATASKNATKQLNVPTHFSSFRCRRRNLVAAQMLSFLLPTPQQNRNKAVIFPVSCFLCLQFSMVNAHIHTFTFHFVSINNRSKCTFYVSDFLINLSIHFHFTTTSSSSGFSLSSFFINTSAANQMSKCSLRFLSFAFDPRFEKKNTFFFVFKRIIFCS